MSKLTDYIIKKALTSSAGLKTVEATFRRIGSVYSWNQPFIYTEPYTGEKNAGELGDVKDYIPDFQTLAARSWQSYTESEIAQLIVHNFLLWTVGAGLKFKAEPQKQILESSGVKVDFKSFIETTENRFNLYINTKRATNTRNKTFNQLVFEAKKHALVGGDCLVVLDYGRTEEKNKSVSARIIDGYYLQDSIYNKAENGNLIINGVEINKYGEPVAYHIITGDNKSQRIAAYTNTNTLQAFLVFGLDYRVDTYRGLPLLSAILESIKKLDRYKEATVGSAEERSKIPYSVEHSQYSTGEDPMKTIKAAMGQNGDTSTTDELTNALLATTASNLRMTTGKQVVNMPIGATLKSLDSKNDLYFKDFYLTNLEIACATVGIPPEVALNKYTSSFSSSRGANKNWEHKILFERSKITKEIYQPFYNFWLETEIYKGVIDAPNYVVAKLNDDFMVIESWQRSRFIGTKMPFIDPLKEVLAARARLGNKTIPLATIEQIVEELDGGDFDINIEQNQKEFEKAKKLGFETDLDKEDNSNNNSKEKDNE